MASKNTLDSSPSHASCVPGVLILHSSALAGSLREPAEERRSLGMQIDIELVKLTPLMARTSGRPEIVIGLIDGPVATAHPDLAAATVCGVSGACSQHSTAACKHGTFVAGILSARRGSAAPAICPRCTLLIRPIFAETAPANQLTPSATPEELATAIMECISAGALLLNLSAAVTQIPSAKHESTLTQVLDYAAKRGVIVVAAAGNQGTVGGTVITRHPWVIAVIGCDRRGRPINQTNLGGSIGRRGLSAPGESITSLSADGKSTISGGTSVAAPFVTGAIALVWSEFPDATAADLRTAVTRGHPRERPTVVPPLLNAMAIHDAIAKHSSPGR